jgi:uncharacterized membrane protein YqjE
MLPESLSKEIRYLVYGLIVFHVVILLLYIWALRKSWNTSPDAQIQAELNKPGSKKIN